MLREAKFDTSGVPQNFVYTSPTITSLAHFVATIALPTDAVSTVDPAEVTAKEIGALISDLTRDLPAHVASARAPRTETVLLTGSTGGLGAAMLAQLAVMPSVSRIYAMNRKSSGRKSLKQRHVEAFVDRGLDRGVLETKKIVFVEGDTSEPGLGIPREMYEEIAKSVTFIAHIGKFFVLVSDRLAR